ncbi:two-component sensor histidine kinase [Trinickia dabaoshanensis]|uniref:histidine kinase n=1 Tax=Trinickia dabaoshanensis TaxID=564714 RepID=A0A2N7VVZ0_9BURK|nr:ATP-binding protein [Trinickia dabaoshanensis]PMS21311.1 two-component sensor histidine kinase [Trinickia dabaoshanensis]
MMPRSLQGRLLVLVTAGIAIVWLLASGLTWHDSRREIDRLLDSHLAQAAALLVMQQAQAADSDEALDAPILHPYAPKVVFQVFHEGHLGIHSANAPAQPMVPADAARAPGFWTVEIGGEAWRVFATPGTQHDTEVFVGERLDTRTSILLAVMRSAFWPMAGALPVLALAIWWAVRRGTAPLRDLGRLLTWRDPRALDPVRMDRAPKEMAPMLDALNRLFDRIRAVLDAERRFTADAAHELRTPIAAIKAQAQVALCENNAALRRHALSAVLEGCDRAVHLVEQLLLLSRLDAGATTEGAVDVDVGALAKQVLADLAPGAIRKSQQLELDAPERCVVMGNAVLLASLIRNLVDNALRYSPAGARISVSIRDRSGHVVMTVQDSGPGLSDADMRRLGDRFFRAPGSGESGSGLGWSIVRRIARVHGASLEVRRSDALGGLKVDVDWPTL